QWAVYYLRDVPLELKYPTNYLAMSHILPLIRKAISGQGERRGELRTEVNEAAEWTNGSFSLVRDAGKTVSGAEILLVQNPYGVKQVNGRRFSWIGVEPMTMVVKVAAEGEYLLLADGFSMGPSL